MKSLIKKTVSLRRLSFMCLFLSVVLFTLPSCGEKDIIDPAGQDQNNNSNNGNNDGDNDGKGDAGISSIGNITVDKAPGVITLSWNYENDGKGVDKVEISYTDPGTQKNETATVSKGEDSYDVEFGMTSYNKEFAIKLTPMSNAGNKGNSKTEKVTVKIKKLGVENAENICGLTSDNVMPETVAITGENGNVKKYVDDSHLLMCEEFGLGADDDFGEDYDFGDDWNRWESNVYFGESSWPLEFGIELTEAVSNFQLWYLPTARGDIKKGMPKHIQVWYSSNGQDWTMLQEVDKGLPLPHKDNARRANRWFSDVYVNQTSQPNVKFIKLVVLNASFADGTSPMIESWAEEPLVFFNLTQLGVKVGDLVVVEVE